MWSNPSSIGFQKREITIVSWKTRACSAPGERAGIRRRHLLQFGWKPYREQLHAKTGALLVHSWKDCMAAANDCAFSWERGHPEL
ncbi:hypothetical protein V5799_011746 [Amblyomma americanum]|uniref:Uncharacterized protein n=1 Tax=Amblyomma americanum TaxID=6943 RepID=A0AAQ4EG04_AMBAM